MKLDSSLLSQACEPVTFENARRNLDLAHQLLRLMRRENGMGLAANQVGIDQRVFVMAVDSVYRHCFNPEIISSSDQQVVLREGCLSFPGEFCEIERPASVQVRYQDAWGKVHEETLTGWHSRCFQHELDHLTGVTMWDLITKN
jgi:peptide deformylase